jgi:hypothetical protein
MRRTRRLPGRLDNGKMMIPRRRTQTRTKAHADQLIAKAVPTNRKRAVTLTHTSYAPPSPFGFTTRPHPAADLKKFFHSAKFRFSRNAVVSINYS